MVHRLPPKALEHHLGIENGRPPGIEYASYGEPSSRNEAPLPPYSSEEHTADMAWDRAMQRTGGLSGSIISALDARQNFENPDIPLNEQVNSGDLSDEYIVGQEGLSPLMTKELSKSSRP